MSEKPKDDKEERKDPLSGPTLDPATGALARTSPSQIKTFSDCPRKWWYEKIAKLTRKPPSKGQLIGSRAHKVIENLLLFGTDQRGALEQSGAHMLEPLIPYSPFTLYGETYKAAKSKKELEELIEKAQRLAPLKVEESINGDIPAALKTPGGVTFIGYSDLFLAPGIYDQLGNPGGNVAHVMDHKFKKKLAEYAESEAELKNDAQKKIYSFAAVSRWPQAEAVRFAHHNHQTEGRREAWARDVLTPAATVRQDFADLCGVVDNQMAVNARVKKDLEVPFNGNSCKKFGGCDFASVCPDSPGNRFLVSIPGVTRPGITIEERKTDMGLLEMAQSAANAAKTQQAAPGAAAPALPQMAAPSLPASVPQVQVAAPIQPIPAAQLAAMPTLPPPPAASLPFNGGPGQVRANQAVQGQTYADPHGRLGVCVGVLPHATILQDQAGMFQIMAHEPLTMIGMPAPQPPPVQAPPPPPVQVPVQTPPPQLPPGVVHQIPLSNGGVHQIVEVPATGAANMINPPGVGQVIAPVGNPEQLAAAHAQIQAAQAAALGQVPQVPVTTVAAVPGVVAATPAAQPQPETEADKKKGKGGKGARKAVESVANSGGLILVIGASVVGENVTDLAPFVKGLHEALCAGQTPPPPDIRLADPKGPFGYGAWRGALAAMALKSPPTGVCVIERGELADPIIEALTPIAELVIYGRR